jgi:hypothetical protein
VRDQGVIVTVLPDDAQLFVSLVSITVFPLSRVEAGRRRENVRDEMG